MIVGNENFFLSRNEGFKLRLQCGRCYHAILDIAGNCGMCCHNYGLRNSKTLPNTFVVFGMYVEDDPTMHCFDLLLPKLNVVHFKEKAPPLSP